MPCIIWRSTRKWKQVRYRTYHISLSFRRGTHVGSINPLVESTSPRMCDSLTALPPYQESFRVGNGLSVTFMAACLSKDLSLTVFICTCVPCDCITENLHREPAVSIVGSCRSSRVASWRVLCLTILLKYEGSSTSMQCRDIDMVCPWSSPTPEGTIFQRHSTCQKDLRQLTLLQRTESQWSILWVELHMETQQCCHLIKW